MTRRTPSLQDAIVELRDLLQAKSIRKGNFTLASGASSNYYCDTKATSLSPEGALLIGEIGFQLLVQDGAEAVGGLAMGATYIANPITLISAQHGRPLYGFTVRESQKGHGLKQLVEESFHPDGKPLLCPGRRVALVDDVVTQGGSLLKAIQEVQQRKCEIVSVLVLVDRQAGGGDRLRETGLPYKALFKTDSQGDLHLNEC